MHINQPATQLLQEDVYYFLLPKIWVVCILAACFGLVSANPLVTAFGFLVPPILFGLLWRTGETPTLLFIATFQWLQSIMPVVMADVEGQPLQEVFGGPELKTAAYLSLTGVLVLALGMRLAMALLMKPRFDVHHQTLELNLNRLLLFYFVSLVFAESVPFVYAKIPSLRQPLVALISIKWIPLFLITYRVFRLRRNYLFFLIPLIFEIVFGFSGFFSSFKNVLMLVLVVGAGAGIQSSRLPWRRIFAVAVLMFLLVSLWQGIKSDYRSFLNKGTRTQSVQVSFVSRMSHLVDLVTSLDSQRYSDGLVSGFERVGYLEFFARSIRVVPLSVEHQNGRIWANSVRHVLMPRIFFPEKESIDESEMTSRFTGRRVAGSGQGTQISIGYMGESYIDFGPIGMFGPIALLGFYYGVIYAWFVNRSGLFGLAIATSLLLFNAYLLETSSIKIFGGITAGFIVLGTLEALIGRDVWDYLTKAAPPRGN